MEARPLRLTSCVVDLAQREAVHDDGRSEHLTPREAELLEYLVAHQDRPVSREELLVEVWGYSPSVASRAADTAVRRLREKIEVDGKQPDHVLTVFGEGYRFAPGRARETLTRAPSTNLTRDPEPFVGRTAEVHLLHEALAAGAWITLVGPPGAGKTRLAQHAALGLLGDLDGGVWFCDWTDATDLAGVVQALAVALDVPVGADRSLDDSVTRLGRAVAGRGPVLVILDNCEQVVDGARVVCEAVHRLAPAARLLATSRQPIDSEDERVVRLDTPSLDEAVQMFAVLARRVRPDFTVTADNEEPVRALVERLERLPLALTLASSRLGAMSVGALLDRMSQRFRLLQDRGRGGTARHRTLTATLDWSWDTLEPDEQRSLARCAVFRGGFTSEAAAAVLDTADAPSMLRVLCERSLLVVRGERFGGYAFVREYAAARLAEHPADRLEAERLHGRYFATLADTASPTLGAERLNLVAAAERAVEAGDPVVAGATAVAATGEAAGTATLAEVTQVALAVLAVPGLSPAHEVSLALRAGTAAQRAGDTERSGDLVERAVAVAADSGDLSLLARAVRGRGSHRRHSGLVQESLADLQQAVALAKQAGDPNILGMSLLSLAIQRREIGELDLARAGLQQVIDLEGETESVNVLHALGNLALLERRESRFAESRALYERALERHRERNDHRAVAIALGGLGNLELDLGNLAAARTRYVQALKLGRDLGILHQVAVIEGNLGLLERAEGDLHAAREHARAALDLFQQLGDPRHVAIALGNLGELDLMVGDLDQAEDALSDSCRELLAMGDRHARAEMLPSLVEVALRRGDLSTARTRVDEATDEARATRNPIVIATALIRRGLVEHAEGTDPTATLREAEPLVEHLEDDAEVHRDLARLRALTLT